MNRPKTLSRSIVQVTYVALLALWACADGADTPGDGGVREASINLDPAVVIGEIDGDPAYLFGDVRTIAVDDERRVYVGDRIGATIRAYSAEGTMLGQVAAEGEGPGEIYGWPADLSFGPGGDLYVRDGSRITVLTNSRDGGIADSVASLSRVPGYGNLSYSLSAVGDDGAYYYPDGLLRIEERPRFFYSVFRGGEATGDTLEVPYHEGMNGQRRAFYRLGPGGGRMVEGLSHVPFAPVPTWGVTARGTILSSDGQSNQLLETDLAGDTVQVIVLEGGAPRQIPTAERADSLRALEARLDSIPVPLEEVMNLGKNVAERLLPEVLPTVVSIHVAEGGLIWVERWPTEGSAASRFYDVFDATGEHKAFVSLRAPLLSEPSPFFGRRAIVGVVRDEDTGVDRVVRFDLADLRQPE